VGLRVYVESLAHPVVATLPFSFEGVPIIKVESGKIVKHGVPGGTSIGHYRITAGTFGGLVRDASTGEPLILSNNHVLANASMEGDRETMAGDRILQPGPYDGGTNIIGHLLRWGYLAPNTTGRANLADCAVARPVNVSLVDPHIQGIGPLFESLASPESVSLVVKSGRTTGVKTGNVIDVDATMTVDYDQGIQCDFVNCIVTTPMSAGGDSGSFLLSQDGRHVVGLLFAGSTNVTLYNNMENVMYVLNVRVPNWNVEWSEVQGESSSSPGGGQYTGSPSGGGDPSTVPPTADASPAVLPILVAAAGVALFAYVLTRGNKSAPHLEVA
jgi:hypothetical protein